MPVAVELLVDNRIAKHQAYFRKDGQHAQYSASCVVLSFHDSVAKLPDMASVANDVPVVAVAPHPRTGWSHLVVRVKGSIIGRCKVRRQHGQQEEQKFHQGT